MKEGGSALFRRRGNVEQIEGEVDWEKKLVIQTTKENSGGVKGTGASVRWPRRILLAVLVKPPRVNCSSFSSMEW